MGGGGGGGVLRDQPFIAYDSLAGQTLTREERVSSNWEVISGGFRGGKGGANAPPLAASKVFLHT